MSDSTDIDVAIVGAGCAGLGAAAAIRSAGRSCVVLEASNRVGGRAWTTHPKELGGVWFDMGAIWFHDAENNPLTAIARTHGDTLLKSDDIRVERTYVSDRLATAAESRDYDGAWRRFETKARALVGENGDVSMADVTRALPDDPWAATIESWEAPVICVADGADFSARDWLNNALGGANLVPDGGVGAFVQRRCVEGLDIRLNCPVRLIRWGSEVTTLETDCGTLRAKSCIVTASTGVLASDALRFDPPLPADTSDAIAALSMGLAIKVALRANGPDRLDLPMHCSVDRQIGRDGDQLTPFQCWPFQRDYVQGWIGGSIAWELAAAGDDAVVDHALSQLRRVFGGRVDRLFAGGQHLITHWDAEPWIRGAYCYARPGHADARRVLAAPLAGGRLSFAGEACHVGFAGTVAGAWISGQQAARAALEGIGPA